MDTDATSTTSVSEPPLLSPKPRRPFDLPSSADASPRASFDSTTSASNTLHPPAPSGGGGGDATATPSRTRSILNLTSSTLLGIYAPTSLDASAPPTPWGTGAQTPARSSSVAAGLGDLDGSGGGGGLGGLSSLSDRLSGFAAHNNRHRRKRSLGSGAAAAAAAGLGGPQFGDIDIDVDRRRGSFTSAERPSSSAAGRGGAAPSGPSAVAAALGRWAALFAFGVAYGALVSRLHASERIAPVQVEGIDRSGWRYLAFWGAAGVALGSAVPWVDGVWAGKKEGGVGRRRENVVEGTGVVRRESVVNGNVGRGGGGAGAARAAGERTEDGGLAAGWNSVVRSVGAFTGIAFAIRKLPWQSTLQVSLTLALVNPALWYLLDRSKPGFTLSLLVGLAGTLALLFINPEIMPAPTPGPAAGDQHHFGGNGSASPSASAAAAASGPDGWRGADAGLEWLSYEQVGVATWIGSVLFCSCVCFGNIGRRLAGGSGASERVLKRS